MQRTPPQCRATPIASMTTPSETFYTASQCGETIPVTQYSIQDGKDETQTAYQQPHVHLIQTLNAAIAEMSRLQVKGGNIAYKANLEGFLQNAMTIAKTMPPTTIVVPEPHSETNQHNGKLNNTQDNQNLRNDITRLNNDLKEIRALLTKTPRTSSQVVTNGEKTEKQGPPLNHRKPRAEQLSKIKEEQAKYSIKLTASTATEKVKKKLEDLTHEEIINHIQQAVDQQYTTDPPQILHGMNKYSNHTYRLQCKDPEDVKKFNTMD